MAWQQFWNTAIAAGPRPVDGVGSLSTGRRRSGEYRNGFYERDYVTRMGTIRLRIARTRNKNFLPPGLRRVSAAGRRGSDADPGGFSARHQHAPGGTGGGDSDRRSGERANGFYSDPEPGQAVRQFHQARLEDEWAYLFLDGVSLRVRRPAGRKRVQMLVAYGVRRDGSRQLLAFLRSQGESQSDWEGLLQDLYRRGLEGKNLQLIVTDGCPGLAAAIPTVYPRARHQRCWVHKMRNILEKVRKSDYDQVKSDAQAIYLAGSRKEAQEACRRFAIRWKKSYPAMVRRLQRDLPELLSFFHFPQHLWRKLRTTNIIERCFVEVRRRTRPMVCFVNVESVDRIIYSIFQRFNLDWKNRTLVLM